MEEVVSLVAECHVVLLRECEPEGALRGGCGGGGVVVAPTRPHAQVPVVCGGERGGPRHARYSCVGKLVFVLVAEGTFLVLLGVCGCELRLVVGVVGGQTRAGNRIRGSQLLRCRKRTRRDLGWQANLP